MSKRSLFVINPIAGRGDAVNLEPLIHRAMDIRGEEYACVRTQCKGHAAELARKFAAEGGDCRIYACGGDGTVNEILHGIEGRDNAALAICPCGTGNDAVRTYGDPAKFRDISLMITSERERKADLINLNGHAALNICSVGVDANVAANVKKFAWAQRLGSGKTSYNLSLIYTMFGKIYGDFKVSLDGEAQDGEYCILTVCNGTTYGGGFRACPDAVPDDGLLDFLLVRRISKLTMMAITGKYQTGGYRELRRYIKHTRGKNLKISSEKPFNINFDGEILRENSVEFSLHPHKLRVIIPE